MSLDTTSRGAGLSPSKRALLERMLKGKAHEAPVLTIPRRPRTEGSPLSFAQQRLWFIHQIDPASPAYNVPIALRLRGRLDREVLHRCLAEVARRHESLRTRFETKAGSPAQVIEADARLELPVVDLAHLPASARELEAQRLAGEEASAPFDLERGPLIRARLLRLAAEDHVFLLGMHHIVSDGWSMGVLVREVAALYEAFAAGRPSPLPELSIQYADFAAWQREALSGERFERDLAYWRERLTPLPAALDIPIDRPRPPVQTFRGGAEHVSIPAEVANGLRALSRSEEATLFMALLAAFDALLARLTSEDDITVGTGIANRTLPELEPLVGFFVNTLVIRASCAGDPTFRELLGRLREATLGAFSHQDLPFERLVEELQPVRDLSRNPIFQVALVLQSAPLGSFDLPGLSIDTVPSETGATRFDLEFHLWEAPGGALDGYLFYNADLFDASTVRRMAQRYVTLLTSAVVAPESRLSELPLLTPEEDLLLAACNRTREDYPPVRVHTLFEAQAARSPDAVAVQTQERRLTYRELDERANQLAHLLKQRGVEPDSIVGIFMERSIEMVVSILGIHKAGGAYLPLDPCYPQARLAFMVRNARAPILVTQTCLLGDLPRLAADVLALDPEYTLLEGESREAPLGGALKENLAYVLYTSGSTGAPKGVMISHGALSNFMQWMTRAFPLTSADTVLQRISPSFDLSVWEFYAPLISGARLFLAAPGGQHDTAYILDTVREHSITTLQFVPSQLALFVEDEALSQCTSLKRVFCGGESIPVELQDRFFELTSAELINFYGPTETTIAPTTWSCRRGEHRKTIPIGSPIANLRGYSLDSRLRPVPVGVPGEMHLAGAGLARGFLGDPALTAERFIPDPFSEEPGGRLYRTGDVVRLLAEGTFEFLGRKDHQVKVRGFRIELGEIESILAEHPAVLKAVVVVLEEDPLPVKGPGFEPVDEKSGGGRGGGPASHLAAYLVLRTGEALSADALRSFLAGRLPRFMIPSIFQTLPSLPLTPNGKIDRRALRELGRAAPPPSGAVAPRTPVEREVARVWSEVLGVQEVGATDNFFDLGGHSLLATQVIARLRAALGVEVPLRAIFEAPTVESLAIFIEQARVAGGVSTRAGQPPTPGPVRRIDRKGPLPLSFAQQRLWFLDKLQPGSAAYNIPCLLRLEGNLDVAALSRALTEIIRRHEALRTRFVEGPQGPEQVIEAPWELRLAAERMEASDPVEAARRLFEAEALRPFDLALGPLVRVRLIHLAESDYAFLLTMHHVVSDGWSIGVLVRELAALYEAYAAGGESPLTELPIQYSDFAVWQRETLAGEHLEQEIAFWRERLSPLPPPLQLPADHPRPPVQTFRGGAGSVSIPAGIAEAMRRLARREGATLFMTLLAAFEALLGRLTGETDLAVGTGIANRTRLELEPLIGFFVNTLVLRVDCSGDPTFRELLGRVREVTLEAYAHQDLPFERLVEELQPARDLSRNPIFQVAFALQNTPSDVFELPGLSLAPFPFDGWTTRFDLEFHLWEEAGGGLGGFLFYSADLFDDTTIRRLIDRYVGLLGSVAEDPACRLSDLPVATADELRVATRVLARGADLPVTPEPVHELFARQAAHAPGAPALVEGARCLTYADLDAASARLAARLRREGVGRGSRVAVLADRSLEQVTAILGVARAGAAYVPLDPGNPDRRIASLLERSGARVVIAPSALAARARRAGGIVIEPEAEETTDAGPGGPFPAGSPADLAYVIFTSGSTGEPNGVEVTHASLSNLVAWHRDAFGVTGTDRATLVAGVGFDASVWELWPYLADGACLLIPDESTRLDPQAMRDWIVSQGVTIAFLPTPLAELVLALDWPPCSLRTLLTGGDRLHAIDAGRLPFRVVNNYGPTEAAVVATSGDADAGASLGVPTIGRPVANARAYVLDTRMRPAPPGVAGELVVGGAGVARGYAARPELTAERFLPDPYTDEPGGRMYRTGDRARQLPDGRIEFLGRADRQVKVRGHRIEPGEVEAILGRHPDVEAAAVVARQETGETRLIAYVTPRRATAGRAAWKEEHLARWRDLYDATYGQTPEGQDASFNITGWNSSYTGEPLPPEEMREWRDQTVARILDLKPRRILEIGCGTGLLLTQIAPRCERYVATDFSRVSLDLIRRAVVARPDLAHVELHERMADDFRGLEPGSFEAVVLNSVVQYFPDAEYLERVLREALRRIADGGHLFVGDVRDARLHRGFAASIALHAAPDSLPAAAARAAAARIVANEEELLVSPGFFAALAEREGRGAWAEALLKRGRADNELTQFRYDAVLHLKAAAPAPGAAEIAWGEAGPDRLREVFSSGVDRVVLRDVPNARVAVHLTAARSLEAAGSDDTVGAVRASASGAGAVHPDDAAVLSGPGWVATAGLSMEGEGTFDLVFARAGTAGTCAALALRSPARDADAPLTNLPLRSTIAGSLAPAVREFAAGQLPEAMVPSVVMVLEAMPLTPNGKVDRRALPAPGDSGRRTGEPILPRTPTEREVARIWAGVLGLEQVGATDNFFELGGHSLLATQMISRIRSVLQVEIPLRAVFEASTVEAFAARLDADAGPAAPAQRIGRVDRSRPIPLSFAQQRLWFLEKLQPGGAAYNVATVMRLSGDLDNAALGRAVAEIERRHEALRTRIISLPEGPEQVIEPPRALVFASEDVTAWAEPRREALRRVGEEAGVPFDLAKGPLWRVRLLRAGRDEHFLSLVLHHTVTDGWSMDLILRELVSLYAAFSTGKESPLADLPIQYADWAAWQRGWLEGGELDRQLAYWRRELDGVESLETPTDRPRSPRRGLRGASLGFELEADDTAELVRFAQAEGATLFQVLLACFQALLARYAASEDVVVGTPVANRTLVETEPLVGFFANTLPIRTRVEPGMTLRALVRRVRGKVLDAYAHQDVPFESIVDELNLPRDLSRNPLFDVMFALQHAGSPVQAPGGLVIEPLAADTGATPFDLTLTMADSGGKISGSLTYDAELFEAPTMKRLVEHFAHLVRITSRDSNTRVGDLDLRTAEERALVEAANSTVVARPACLMHALVEARAALAPDDAAVVDEQETLSYAELEALSNRIAHRLQRAGVGLEMGVGLLSGRTARSIAGMLGILKSGGMLVPLEASLPAARLAAMLSLARVRAVVSERGLDAALPDSDLEVVRLEADDLSSESADPLEQLALPSNAAYVIFTSGSTGEPKGVVVEHGAIAERSVARAEQSGLGPGDRMLHFHSPVFDGALEEILTTLCSGATVVVHPDPRGETPEGFLQRAAGARLTVAHLPVGFLHLLADDLAKSGAPLPGSLRHIITGGESPSGTRLAALLRGAARGRLTVCNAYGPTEAVIEATAYYATSEEETRDPVPIGLPIANSTVHLLDRRMRPVPLGATGEIYIGGKVLARGYAGRSAETAASFLPDPFSAEPGARLYRTGDLARRRSHGELVFLGRRDGQVKLRGFRVELGEIETALSRLDSVREAAVLVRERGAGAYLVAYVVPAGGTELDAGKLRAALAAVLPDYMVPRIFIPLVGMPRTATGKVDRRALPAPERETRKGKRLPPRDDLERALAGFWAEALGGGGDDIEEDFFEAGGNSLLAMRIVGSIRRELNADLPVSAVFREPTIAGLARLLRSDALETSPLVTLRAGAGLPPLVCVHEVGGGISAFAALADHLDPRRPVLGIHGFDDAPAGRIEDAAARYAGAIARAVPEGPIDLLGWSYGGLVAYETALSLSQAGREVRTLVLLDAAAPGDEAQEERNRPALASTAAAMWGIEVEKEDAGEVLAAARDAGALPAYVDGEQAAAWLAGVAARMDAAESYHPRPYEGKVVLVRGTESDIDRAGDDTLGWRRFVTGSLALEWAPGSHYSIVRGDGARTIAAIVERHVARTGAAEELVEKLETMPDEEARRRMERDIGFVQRVSDER